MDQRSILVTGGLGLTGIHTYMRCELAWSGRAMSVSCRGRGLANFGHEVVCIDTDENKIAALRSGHVPIYEPGLSELVLANQTAGRLSFATSLREA
jgi:UDPglucose 6-dehydrogenase